MHQPHYNWVKWWSEWHEALYFVKYFMRVFVAKSVSLPSLTMCALNDISVMEECKEGSKMLLTVFMQKKNEKKRKKKNWINLCQELSLSWNEMYVSCGFTQHKFRFLTPAGTNEHPLMGGRVRDGSVVMDKGRVKGHTIHVQGHWGELDTEWKMMPLTVTHLLDRDNGDEEHEPGKRTFSGYCEH